MKQLHACQDALEKKESARMEERVGRTAVEKELRAILEAKLDVSAGYYVQPIATVQSCFAQCLGTPRQGLLAPLTRGRVLCHRNISPDTLDGLSDFSHVWITFVFHANTNGKNARAHDGLLRRPSSKTSHTFRAKISPPMLKRRMGIFATRTPHRPNPIGMTLAKIEQVDMAAKSIWVSGLDLVEGTPVLDLKPYVPSNVVRFDEGKQDAMRQCCAAQSVHYQHEPDVMMAVLAVDVRSQMQTTKMQGKMNLLVFDNVHVKYTVEADNSLCTTLRSFSRASSRFASTLVVAEHNGEALTGGTLSAITAASKIGGDITVLVSGSNTANIAKEAAAVQGVKSVLHADAAQFDHAIAEELSSLVVTIQKGSNFSHIVAPSSNISKNFFPRVGAALDVAPFTDVLTVVDENTFQRPLYAGNAIATVTSSDSVKLLTVRPTGFEKAAVTGGSGVVSAAPAAPAANLTRFVSEETSSSERPDLTAARVVVSGGRGLKSGENFALLNTLADKLKGAVGASRAAVDAGFVPNELQIGQTGKVVAPELYIAVGISGAIQHLAGMKDSKTIVAINKDAEAPIFQVADYGLVEDLFKALPELTEKI
ncbi:hypothetical protein DYB31_002821 [Aphanomyces astaci]|uniref:TsaA-like domain-containing protein n=3 Tax=Aphanomyces astaci TaxID=112090 RepID=A0A397F620_APHAT|nr:hypothetical protein DYB31_002821 [Aphanomyces astaci]